MTYEASTSHDGGVAPAARADRFIERIAARDSRIGIIGLGYVGLPLALSAWSAGFSVLGFDINADRVARINAGEAVIEHLSAERMRTAIASARFEATTDFDRLRDCDAIIIAVPTPLTKNREPDLSFVERTVEAIAQRLRADQLVVLESTTWPGTTAEIVKPVLERTGLRSGTDFFVAFSPEREDPGNPDYTTSTIPKVVGGDGPAALAVADALYRAIVVRTVQVPTPATAEAVKLTENIFRSVNIALVNELKVIYGRMGIDIWDVIEAAKTKPFGYMPFYPGPGLGGHCIPIDPFYLTWKAREYDVTTRFIELAGQINSAMPQHVVDRLAEALDRAEGRGLRDAAILVLGIAYKKNVDDCRESASFRLIELLEARGARVSFHDPHIAVIPPTREHGTLTGRRSVPLDETTLRTASVVLIATDHDGIDYGMVARLAGLVIDTRNACGTRGIVGDHIVKA